jgi:hypothetical protein
VIRLIVLLALACATAVTPTAATARVRHNVPHTAYWRAPTYDPNAVFVGGTHAGSDSDLNIRSALVRGFGRQ